MIPSTQKEKMLRLCLAVKPHLWLGCGCNVPELETLIPNSPGILAVEVRFGVAGPYKVTTKKTSLIPGSQAVFAFCLSFYTHMHFCSHEPRSLWFLPFCLAEDFMCFTAKHNFIMTFTPYFFLFLHLCKPPTPNSSQRDTSHQIITISTINHIKTYWRKKIIQIILVT